LSYTAQRRAPRIATLAVLVAALLVPVASAWGAAPAGANIEADPENETVPTGTKHRIVVALENGTVNPSSPVNVVAEIDGPNDPRADGSTPSSPDIPLACSITGVNNPNTTGLNEETTCDFKYTGTVAGTDTIRIWFEGSSPDASEPANDPDLDQTDVLLARWFDPIALGSSLNCSPESSSNPVSGPQSGQPYLCTLQRPSGGPLAGQEIDGENLEGANDPEATSADDAKSADYDSFCTTNLKGQCRGTVPGLNDPGRATICFWADEDHNALAGGRTARNGAACSEPVNAPDLNNTTDKVVTQWRYGRSATLQASAQAVRAGGRVRLSGKVTSDAPGCFAGVTITIKRDVLGGARTFSPLKTIKSSDTGSFSTYIAARKSASYKATLGSTAVCSAAASPGRYVKVT
jgi:hypothetical protein